MITVGGKLVCTCHLCWECHLWLVHCFYSLHFIFYTSNYVACTEIAWKSVHSPIYLMLQDGTQNTNRLFWIEVTLTEDLLLNMAICYVCKVLKREVMLTIMVKGNNQYQKLQWDNTFNTYIVQTKFKNKSADNASSNCSYDDRCVHWNNLNKKITVWMTEKLYECK